VFFSMFCQFIHIQFKDRGILFYTMYQVQALMQKML